MPDRKVRRRLGGGQYLLVGALLVVILASATVVQDLAVREFFAGGRDLQFQRAPVATEQADLLVPLAGDSTIFDARLPRFASASTRYELQRVPATAVPRLRLRVDVCDAAWSRCEQRVDGVLGEERTAFSLPADGSDGEAHLRLTLDTTAEDRAPGETVRIAWRAVAE